MDNIMEQDIVMVKLITAGTRLNKTDYYFIAGVIRGYIEGGDYTALRDVLDNYYRNFQFPTGIYYQLIDYAQIERNERIVRK